MFCYDCIDVIYSVSYGKCDGGAEVDYSFSLNENEAKAYTKARMLGEELEDTIDICRCEREVIEFNEDEYDDDISSLPIHIRICDEYKQPDKEDVEAYLTDLLKMHEYELVHKVVEAQINVYKDKYNDWKQIALDLAVKNNCKGYVEKYKNEGK